MLTELNLSRDNLKRFGRTMFFCLLAIGVILFFRHNPGFKLFWLLAGMFLFLGQLFPLVLKPVYRIWMLLAFCLGWVNTRLILLLVYYLVVTPIGLIMRLFGQDLLGLRLDKQAQTYWIKRKDARSPRQSYERIF